MEIVTLGVNRQNTETKEEKNLIRINKESDFPLAIKLSKSGQVVPFPECDFTMEAHIEGSSDIYRAKRKGGVCKHCKQDGDRLIVFFDNHNFVEGRLLIELTIEYPDPDYSEDGIRQEHFVELAPIQIVADNGDALDLRLPEPRIVEKVVEKNIPLPAGIKELAEAPSKLREYNYAAEAEGYFYEDDDVFDALVSQELLKLPKDIVFTGDLVSNVNEFAAYTTTDNLAAEAPFMEQVSRIALLKAYAQSDGLGVPISRDLFCGVYLNQLNLTLRGMIDIQGMFALAFIRQVRIYLTDNFKILNNRGNDLTPHKEWVEYRNSDNSEEMTSGSNGNIKFFHLKFDAIKQEQAITLIRSLGFGAVENIYLEATEPIDGETFSRWLVEALKPYTDDMKAIRYNRTNQVFKPKIYFIGGNFGNVSFDGYVDAYKEKGYVV